MTWIAPGFEASLKPLIAAFGDASWPDPPEGFAAVDPVRPMRQVVRGRLDGPAGPLEVAVKWSRPVTGSDRVSRVVRGGKAPREGEVLRVLQLKGLSVPAPIAFAASPADVLITVWQDDLTRAPEPDAASAALVHAFAEYVATLHDAGVRHRDLTSKNVALQDGAPFLLDVGGAKSGAALTRKARVTELARIANGWLRTARRTVRLRALRAYMRAWGESGLRTMEREVVRRARALRRRFLAGRDRRPTREGRHFHLFQGGNVTRGVRAALLTDASWENAADAWLIADPPDAEPLKAGGRVVRVPSPSGGAPVVLKRFDGVAKGRVPRPLRALRRAEAFRHRHLPVPRALMAAVGRYDRGLLVSESVDAPNLHAFMAGGDGGAFAALAPAARRAFLRRVGRALRLMHDAEVTHRDLKAPNLLVDMGCEDPPRILFADLEGARIRRRPIAWSRRARDLARLDASLGAHRTDRLRVLRAYLAVPPWPEIDIRRLLDRIASRVAWKRGPSGDPK